jgi:hypothetical protein
VQAVLERRRRARLYEYALWGAAVRENCAQELRVVSGDDNLCVMRAAQSDGRFDARIAAAQGDEARDRLALSQVGALEPRLDRPCQEVGDPRQHRECQRACNECAGADPLTRTGQQAFASCDCKIVRRHRRPASKQADDRRETMARVRSAFGARLSLSRPLPLRHRGAAAVLAFHKRSRRNALARADGAMAAAGARESALQCRRSAGARNRTDDREWR